MVVRTGVGVAVGEGVGRGVGAAEGTEVGDALGLAVISAQGKGQRARRGQTNQHHTEHSNEMWMRLVEARRR